MASNLCNFSSIKGGSSCSESFSGIGTTAFYVPAAQFSASGKKHPELSTTKAEYTAESFASTNAATVYEFPIASGTGKVTASSNGKYKGFQNVFTGRVEKDQETMAANLRTMNNSEFYYILVDSGKTVTEGEGEDAVVKHVYYVVGSSTFAPTLELSYDSGAAPTDESGHTVTITAGPCLYARPTWTGVLTSVSAAE